MEKINKESNPLSINYKSIADLNFDILNNLSKFPHDIDLIVGIPRSGMLPANLLALYLHKPYTDIDSFVNGHIYSGGVRSSNIQNTYKKVLVLDDSVCSGNALKQAKEKLIPLNNKYDIKFACIYIIRESIPLVDFYAEIIPLPRFFQWNIFNHPFLNDAFFDIDGVLCEDPKVDDDGPIYLDYIQNAKPKIIPKCRIGTIVTCRLEKYRDITETWLANQGIEYDRLIMLPFKTKQERINWGKYAEFKALHYSNSKSPLFIESNLQQAKIIHELTRKLVFCTENYQLLNYETKKRSSTNKIKNWIIRYTPKKIIDFYLIISKK